MVFAKHTNFEINTQLGNSIEHFMNDFKPSSLLLSMHMHQMH